MSRRLVLALLGIIAAGPTALAQNLTVNIEPVSAIPETVAIEIDGVPTDLNRYPPTGAGYQGKIALPTSVWANTYLVVARWPAPANKAITLRIARDTPAAIKVWIYNRGYPPEKTSLDKIDNGQPGLTALLERYFVARDVYFGIPFQTHEVKIRALKLWFDAAYNLSKTYRYIARDEDVVTRADEIEARRKTDPQLADIVRRLAGSPDYFGLMNKQFKALFLNEIAQVEQQVRTGNIDNAELINNHFIKKLSTLSEEDRKALLVTQSLRPDVLENNARYLATLKVEAAARKTSAPQ